VQQWIQGAKSAKGLGAAKLLGGLLRRGIEQADVRMPDALIPVPLALTRLFRRGHNQAILLAVPLARHFGIPVHRRGVQKVGGRTPQRGQSRSTRALSVRDSFHAKRRFSGHLAIVDDVMTTGATVAALASTLRAAGAERVDVWALARVPSTPRP